jgi:hypothetical protein
MDERITGYVYSLESRKVIAEITGLQKSVEQYVDDNYDDETCGLTYSPAFGFSGGLIATRARHIIDASKEKI